MNTGKPVSLTLLLRYLAAHGWQRVVSSPPSAQESRKFLISDDVFVQRMVGAKNVDVWVLRGSGEPDVELVVPRNLDEPDGRRRLDGALETLSQVEERTPEEVIADVRTVGFDVMRSRIPEDQIYADSIHLEQAVNYISSVKRLLAAGATTEMVPGSYFLRVRKEASAYAEHCRFGHTFKGSFGFTVESPIPANVEPTLPGISQVPPFERRVIQRIARGMFLIDKAVTSEDPTLVTNGFESGFSANMCEEFAELVEQTSPAGLTFAFTLSPEWPSLATSELSVGVQHIEIARSAAKTMLERPLRDTVEVSGRIIRLQNEADPTDLQDETHEREVVVYWRSETHGDVSVRMSLAPSDYLSAVRAHMQGQQVRAKGRLERLGRRWVLMDLSDFSI